MYYVLGRLKLGLGKWLSFRERLWLINVVADGR